ncbi:MAG: hypothetical protein CMP48_17400 [Rickettsiales bacterium]|jgi:hypothetical protein|nr:hypothetical protein [Rickettsiales bacterium]
MNEYDFETLGYYEPGFLHLRINTDDDLVDLNELARKQPEVFSTFLHEYIHFLQDLTTTSGLMNSNLSIHFLQELTNEVRLSQDSKFSVPIGLSNANNLQVNIELKKFYDGESTSRNYAKYSHHTVEKMSFTDKNGKKYSPEKYVVHYHDKNGKQKQIHFGSVCLKEYVAHAIQTQYLPGITHPDIPYVLPKLIIESEYPELKDDSLKIALCDASLMSLHPSQMFFNTIEKLKKRKRPPNSAFELYEFAYKDLKFRNEVGSFSVEELFEEKSSHIQNQLHDALQSEPFIASYRWLEYVIREARKIRLDQPTFFAGLVHKEGLSDQFFSLFRKLGTPFFTNSKGKGGFIPPSKYQTQSVYPYQLRVFRDIIATFYGQKKCSLHPFCSSLPEKDITNEKCLKAPWERVHENELCPFAQLWKTWGLSGKTPK